MKKDQNSIDQLFHQQLAGAADQPPARIWDNIDTVLDLSAADLAAQKKERKRRYAFYIIFFAIAGTGALLWGTGGFPGGDKQTLASAVNASSGKPAPVAGEVRQGSSAPWVPLAEEKQVAASAITDVNSARPSLKRSPDMMGDRMQNESLVPTASSSSISSNLERPVLNMQPANIEAGVQPAPMNTFVRGEIVPCDIYQRSTNTVPQQLYEAHPSLANRAPAPLVTIQKLRRFSVTLFFAPDITTRNLEQNFFTALDERKEELLRTEKNGALDFTVGARVEYKLNKRFSIQSGLSFSTNTIDIASKMVFARFDRDGALKFRFNLSSGYTYFKPKTMLQPRFLGDTAQALSSSSVLHYVNVPLALKYNFPSGRFNFSVQAGLTARFITAQSIDAVYAFNGANEKTRSNEIQGLKTTYFNGVVGAGVDYSLNRNIALTLFPSFNFATTSINRDAPVKAYPNTVSVALGVKVGL